MTSEQAAPFSIESLLGKKLLTKVGTTPKSTKELMKGKELMALDFSASWCPPCKAFSPVLAEFYTSCANDAKVEIIYVSSDRTVPDFEGYFKTMPWLSIDNAKGSAAVKQELAEKLGVSALPTLVVLDVKTGEFLTSMGREDVFGARGNAGKGKEVIEKWKALERRPLSACQAELAGGAGGSLLMKIFVFFARNPMYIFGLLYFYKYLKQKSKVTDDAGPESDPVPEFMQEDYDSEF